MSAINRNPVTDVLGRMLTNQNHGPCRDFELHFYECMESYGLPKGWKECADYYDDFMECIGRAKQVKRVQAMQAERLRQYRAGERTKRNYYATPPKTDSFPKFGA